VLATPKVAAAAATARTLSARNLLRNLLALAWIASKVAAAAATLHQLHQHLVRENHAARGEAQAIGGQISLE
jgi:hypothetical protein